MGENKPGIETSEFWGKNVVQIVTLAVTAYTAYSGHAITPEQQAHALQTALAIVGGLEAVYSASRGFAKSRL